MSRVERHAAEEAMDAQKNTDNINVEKPADKRSRKGKGRLTPLGKVLSFTGSFIMWAVILLCLVLAAPRLAGIKSYVVISGSMEPAIPVGSIVYAKETDPAELTPGEIVVFYSSDKVDTQGNAVPVTHRVVENDTERGELITKGDANEKTDLAPVSYVNVLGRVVYSIRRLGYLASLLSSAAGKVAAVMIIAAGYILSEVGGRLRRE